MWCDVSFKSKFFYFAVRLNGTGNPGSGRVEVYFNGVWGTVCGDLWDINDGHVVCRMLGYTHALEVSQHAKYRQGARKIWLDDVKCSGNEKSVSLCAHQPWGSHNCDHSKDAGVACSTKGNFDTNVIRIKRQGKNWSVRFQYFKLFKLFLYSLTPRRKKWEFGKIIMIYNGVELESIFQVSKPAGFALYNY